MVREYNHREDYFDLLDILSDKYGVNDIYLETLINSSDIKIVYIGENGDIKGFLFGEVRVRIFKLLLYYIKSLILLISETIDNYLSHESFRKSLNNISLRSRMKYEYLTCHLNLLVGDVYDDEVISSLMSKFYSLMESNDKGSLITISNEYTDPLLYNKLGFIGIEKYNYNGLIGTVYLKQL